jgi:hypothetical protein
MNIKLFKEFNTNISDILIEYIENDSLISIYKGVIPFKYQIYSFKTSEYLQSAVERLKSFDIEFEFVDKEKNSLHSGYRFILILEKKLIDFLDKIFKVQTVEDDNYIYYLNYYSKYPENFRTKKRYISDKDNRTFTYYDKKTKIFTIDIRVLDTIEYDGVSGYDGAYCITYWYIINNLQPECLQISSTFTGGLKTIDM